MQAFIFNGVTYPVSDRFGALDVSPTASEDEQARANARRATLANIVRFLDGQMPEDVLGVGATLDRVHGQTWAPDTCGCRVAMVFDHYADDDKREPKGHRTQRVCPHHVAHAAGHSQAAQRAARGRAHTDALLDENRHKNRAVALVADELQVDAHEVEWSLDDARVLTVKHAALTPDKRSKVDAQLAALDTKRLAKAG